MDKNRSKTLTQDEIVAQLHELGYTDMTKRRIALWRANDLLPSFDIIGGGRGRQRGRECNAWSNGEQVLNQAAQVSELLKMYKSFDDLYLPLWMLNYPIPPKRLRDALSGPLDQAVRDAEVEVDGRSAVEDEIDDAAYQISGAIERANMKIFEVPPDALAALTNILMNSSYNLNDQPFQDGVEALEKWDQTFQERCTEIFGEEVGQNISLRRPNDTMWTIFTHAPFINEYLTVQSLKQAVDECRDEDLEVVQRDLQVGREIVLQVKRLLTLLMPFIPGELKSTSLEDLAAIFQFGKVCIWVDLALRRSGYGWIIDALLPFTLAEIEKHFNQEMERELVKAGPQITVAIESVFQHLGVPLNGEERLSP